MQAEAPEFYSLLLPSNDSLAACDDDSSLASLSPTCSSSPSHHLAAIASGFSSPNSLESVESFESYFLGGAGGLSDVASPDELQLFASSSLHDHGHDSSSLLIKPDLDLDLDLEVDANDFFTTTINIKHEPFSSPPASPLAGCTATAAMASPSSSCDLSSPEMPASPALMLSPPSPSSASPMSVTSSSSSSSTSTTKTNANANRKRNFTEMRETDTAKAPATLSREELLNMSSHELEEYTEKLASARPLTSQEERLFKRQRRLIKNRESAQLSRQRKKHYIEELERQVRDANAERDHIASQLAGLSTENKSLKDEVQYLRNFIKQSPHLSAAATAAAAKSLRAESATTTASTQTVKAASVCLLIVLFSFGLFFNANNGPNPTLPSLGRREPIPQVIPPTMNRLYTGRVLQSIEDDSNNVAVAEMPVQQQQQQQQQHTTSVEHKRKFQELDDSPLAVASVEPKAKRSRIAVQPESELELPATVPTKAEPKAALTLSTASSSTLNNILPHLAKDESVVYCAEAHRIMPTGGDDQLPITKRPYPPVFSLLIPPSALNGTVPNVDKLDPNTLLDVTCQIMSINVVPTLAVEQLPIPTM